MDTFALYFCSSVKQKMKPTEPEASVEYDADGMPVVSEGEDEFGGSGMSEEIFDSVADDDDDL